MNKFFRYTLITLLICVTIGVFYTMGYCIAGEIVKKPNVIVKQNSEYLWVKKYTMYNEDSCVYKYHQPILHVVLHVFKEFLEKVDIEFIEHILNIMVMKNIQKEDIVIMQIIKKAIKLM